MPGRAAPDPQTAEAPYIRLGPCESDGGRHPGAVRRHRIQTLWSVSIECMLCTYVCMYVCLQYVYCMYVCIYMYLCIFVQFQVYNQNIIRHVFCMACVCVLKYMYVFMRLCMYVCM